MSSSSAVSSALSPKEPQFNDRAFRGARLQRLEASSRAVRSTRPTCAEGLVKRRPQRVATRLSASRVRVVTSTRRDARRDREKVGRSRQSIFCGH